MSIIAPVQNNWYIVPMKTQEVAEKAGVKIRIVQRWAQNHNVDYKIVDMRVVYEFTDKQVKEFLSRDTKRGRRWPDK